MDEIIVFWWIQHPARVKQDILDCTRNILILLTFHKRIFLHIRWNAIAIKNIPVFIESVNNTWVVYVLQIELHTYPVGSGIGNTGFRIDKKLFPVRRVNKTVAYSVHRLETEDTESSVLSSYFIDDIRIGVGEIIFRIALFFNWDSQLLCICIVKKRIERSTVLFPTPCVPIKCTFPSK